MVRQLESPTRPLKGGLAWTWSARGSYHDPEEQTQESWIRVFHAGDYCPSPTTRRTYGPLCRFDHHTVDHDDPKQDRTGPLPPDRECPSGRSVIYLARFLRTALAEVFDKIGQAAVCPGYRVAALQVTGDCLVQDLTGAASLQIGALPALGCANEPRPLTQRWARAIYEDDPTGTPVDGILYPSAHDLSPCLALFDRAPELAQDASPPLIEGGLPLLDAAIKPRIRTLMRDIGVPFREIDSKDCSRCRP